MTVTKTELPKSKAERELEDLERVFDALAHRSRRHILVVLNARGGQMTAGEIAKRFSCSWPTTTRHLRLLESAGLVSVEKHGRESHYVLNAKRLHEVVGGWLGWIQSEPRGMEDEA
jgi:DNA-binding transcriptional ArsR family regulator